MGSSNLQKVRYVVAPLREVQTGKQDFRPRKSKVDKHEGVSKVASRPNYFNSSSHNDAAAPPNVSALKDAMSLWGFPLLAETRNSLLQQEHVPTPSIFVHFITQLIYAVAACSSNIPYENLEFPELLALAALAVFVS